MQTDPNTAVLHILIAEDDAGHTTAIRRRLEQDYPEARMTVVASLREYRESIAAVSPTIAIMDLNLPDGRSLDLLTAVPAPAFPVIIMTSFGNEQVAVDAIKAGALDYIVKSTETFAAIGASVGRALREWSLLQEKKQMEQLLKESQAQIIQQEKMASIGQLAAGVAHEINNPMGYITSNMNMLGRYADKLVRFIEAQSQAVASCADEATKTSLAELRRQLKLDAVMKDLRELIDESLEGANRVSKIVQDLKSFSRAEGNEAVRCDLNETIRSTINIVHNEIKYVAELELQLGDIPAVLCRPQQISQVVMNLLVNAAHAITGKGIIRLATTLADDTVEINVSDNGGGISPEHLEKIFEPFFTTKEAGKGTGLGLAISSDIVRKHGGELLVRSVVGSGTTFTVRLPCKQELSG
ncbi:MAG: ATP-binding protein [Geobacteraceae bacterium]|nr:ATP-binding protein [Geobacteraceae bacterium]